MKPITEYDSIELYALIKDREGVMAQCQQDIRLADAELKARYDAFLKSKEQIAKEIPE
jgi:hypothetical protein